MLKLFLIAAILCISSLNGMEMQSMRMVSSYVPIEKDLPGNTESPLDNEIFQHDDNNNNNNINRKEEIPFGVPGTVPKELSEFVSQFMPYLPEMKKSQKKSNKKSRKSKKTKPQTSPETIIDDAPQKQTPFEIIPHFRLPSIANFVSSILDSVLPEFPNLGRPEAQQTQLPNYPKSNKKPQPTISTPLAFGKMFHSFAPFFGNDQQSPLSQFVQILSGPKPTTTESTPTKNLESQFPLPKIIMDIMSQSNPEGNTNWKVQVGDSLDGDGEMVVNIEPVQKGTGTLAKTMVFNVPMQMDELNEGPFNILDFL